MRHLVAALTVVIAVTTAAAQPRLAGASPLPTADQIVANAGSEADATDLMRQVLRNFFPVHARSDNGAVYVLASQLRPEWLPDVPQVRWVRLAEQEATTHNEQCGRLLLVQWVRPFSIDRLSLAISGGTKCHSRGAMPSFVRRSGRWEFAGGIAGDITGGIVGDGDCPCR
jgi:hypothetical protein